MRRFIVWVGVLIGAFFTAALGIGLFLMLAPGAKLFGIQYIRQSKANSAELTKTYTEEVSGGLVFDTKGVPISIEFHPYSSFEFNFVQNYNGFTRTKVEKPNISVEVNAEGDLVVKTTEFKKFLWGNNANGYHLNCKLPATYRNHTITISSDSSKVHVFSNEDVTSDISELVVCTKGAVSFGGKMNIQKLVINDANNKITIPETVTVTNAYLTCKNKGATIKSPVLGELNFESKKGSLEFISANTLVAETKGGRIKSTSQSISVVQNATIKTLSRGNVSLQYVGGDLSVTTKNGSVSIGTHEDGTMGGVGGKVNIQTNTGNVKLWGNYSDDKIVFIKTKSGKITVGDNGRTEEEKKLGALATVHNLEIETKTGKVSVEQAETVKITSSSANVTVGKFVLKATITTTSGDVTVGGNTLGGVLNIKTGTNGHVKATNLGGATTISSGGKISAVFANVLGKIDIAGTSKEINVVVPNGVTTTTNHIWVESQKKSATIAINGLENTGKKYRSVESVPVDEEYKLIKITSTSGKITLKSK